MKKISVFEARAALRIIASDVETSEGYEAAQLLREFLDQYPTIKEEKV